jgi:hypothetical protein
MSIIEQITKNLLEPDKHGPILEALVDILEEQGERGVKERIRRWIEEIKADNPPLVTGEE